MINVESAEHADRAREQLSGNADTLHRAPLPLIRLTTSRDGLAVAGYENPVVFLFVISY